MRTALCFSTALLTLVTIGLCRPFATIAQTNHQADIRGTIADPSGALVPNAKITITDVGTSIAQKTATEAEWSVNANDATNRFVAAAMLKLPIGRGSLIGGDMNRVSMPPSATGN